MNSVVHFEIPYEDVSRASEFYKSTFGWEIQSMPEMNYTIAITTEVDPVTQKPKLPGAINGGFYQKGGIGSQTPVIVINVESVDVHITKVEAAGGKAFMPKVQVGNMGFYAQVQDTEGNIIGLWQMIPPGSAPAVTSEPAGHEAVVSPAEVPVVASPVAIPPVAPAPAKPAAEPAPAQTPPPAAPPAQPEGQSAPAA